MNVCYALNNSMAVPKGKQTQQQRRHFFVLRRNIGYHHIKHRKVKQSETCHDFIPCYVDCSKFLPCLRFLLHQILLNLGAGFVFVGPNICMFFQSFYFKQKRMIITSPTTGSSARLLRSVEETHGTLASILEIMNMGAKHRHTNMDSQPISDILPWYFLSCTFNY